MCYVYCLHSINQKFPMFLLILTQKYILIFFFSIILVQISSSRKDRIFPQKAITNSGGKIVKHSYLREQGRTQKVAEPRKFFLCPERATESESHRHTTRSLRQQLSYSHIDFIYQREFETGRMAGKSRCKSFN